jgi:hypothetical protein
MSLYEILDELNGIAEGIAKKVTLDTIVSNTIDYFLFIHKRINGDMEILIVNQGIIVAVAYYNKADDNFRFVIVQNNNYRIEQNRIEYYNVMTVPSYLVYNLRTLLEMRRDRHEYYDFFNRLLIETKRPVSMMAAGSRRRRRHKKTKKHYR